MVQGDVIDQQRFGVSAASLQVGGNPLHLGRAGVGQRVLDGFVVGIGERLAIQEVRELHAGAVNRVAVNFQRLVAGTAGFGVNGANFTGGAYTGNSTYITCISYVDVM